MDNEFERALATSFRILAKKAYSIKEIEKKLIGFTYSEETTEKVIEKLIEYGFLNDDEYADLIVESYKTRGYGKQRIKEELYKRGLSSEIIKSYDLSCDYDIILNYYGVKLNGETKDYKLIEKTKAFLYRKGFTFDEINHGFYLYKEQLED